MAIESLYASSHISGGSTGANAVGAPDATFTTDTGATSWTGLWELDNPTLNPTTPQSVTVVVTARRSASGGSGVATITAVTVLNGTTTIATNSTSQIVTNDTTGATYSFTIPSATYPSDGSGLRVEVATTGSGGGPNARCVQIDAVRVDINTSVLTLDASGTIRGGGGISATVSADHSVAVSVKTGGNITTTLSRPNYSTSLVSLGIPAATPYYDALDVWVRWRVSSSSMIAGSSFAWTIRDGANLIANSQFASAATTTFSDHVASLSPAQAANITNWANLRLELNYFLANGSGLGVVEVADVWLSVPASVGDPSRTGELNTGGGLTATVTHDAAKTGTIRSGGGITATVAKQVSRTGTIRTGPNLTATTTGDHANASVVNGGGGITATATHDASKSGTLRSGGGISSSVTGEHSSNVGPSGGGGITSTTTRTATTSGVVNNGGGISATVTRTVSAAVTVRTGGGITATTTGDHAVPVAANTGANLIPTVTGDHTTSGTINGGGRILPSLGVNVQTSGTISGGGGISATVSADHAGSGTLNTGGGIASTVLPDHATSGTLNTGGGVDTTTAGRRSSTALVRGGGRLLPALGSSRSVTTSIRSGGSITATAIKQGGNPQVSAILNGGGGIAASVAPTRTAFSSMNSGGGIAASTSHTATGIAEVSSGGGVSTQTTPIHTATGLTRAGGGIAATASPGVGWTDLELALAPADDPLSNRMLPHFIHFRYRSGPGTNAQTNWWLMCGTTEITSGILLTSTTSFIEASVQLAQGEVDLITDYSDMRIRLQRGFDTNNLLISDVWFEVPLIGNPYAASSLETGGGITATVTATHIVEEFPSPANAMLGPAMQSGGGITASLQALPQGQGILNTGGGISASVTSTHSVAASISTGGRITPSTAEAAVQVVINGGGRIVSAISPTQVVATGLATGGGISTLTIIPIEPGLFGPPPGHVRPIVPPVFSRASTRSGWIRRIVGKPPRIDNTTGHSDIEQDSPDAV